MKKSPVSMYIDRLTNSVINVITGDVFGTEVRLLTSSDKVSLKKNWLFDWRREMNTGGHTVWKVVIQNNPNVIQGLISTSDKGDHIFVNLVENAYFNIGKGKVYEGVGGNLFAFACKQSFDAGYDGVVSFVAKSALIPHYNQMLGAEQLGASLRMVIDTEQSQKLVSRYFTPST
jgi:hypothetical protein